MDILCIIKYNLVSIVEAFNVQSPWFGVSCAGTIILKFGKADLNLSRDAAHGISNLNFRTEIPRAFESSLTSIQHFLKRKSTANHLMTPLY
jgi:hypothetical protein